MRAGLTDIPPKLRARMQAPVYRISEAARFTEAKPQTVYYWHKGTGAGPAIRRSPENGGKSLSYMELVEVAFVAAMRSRGVSLQAIRRAREYVRRKIDSPYPFATYRFKTDGKHILLDLKDFKPDADEHDVIVLDRDGQLAWGNILASAFARFDYEKEIARRWHPLGHELPVIIDPAVAFGEPNVNGVATWVIKNRVIAGEKIDEIQRDFEVTETHIRAALEFEKVTVPIRMN